MLKFNSLLIFSETPDQLAEFYQKIFNSEPIWKGEGYTTWQVGEGYITVGPHDKVKGTNQHPERIMFNFETEELQKEFERIKGLGAKVIKEPYAMEGEDDQIATFADPENNIFQLMSPMPTE